MSEQYHRVEPVSSICTCSLGSIPERRLPEGSIAQGVGVCVGVFRPNFKIHRRERKIHRGDSPQRTQRAQEDSPQRTQRAQRGEGRFLIKGKGEFMVRQAHHERLLVIPFALSLAPLSESKGRRVKAVHGSTSSPRTVIGYPVHPEPGSPERVEGSKGEGGSWFDKLTTNGYWLFRSP